MLVCLALLMVVVIYRDLRAIYEAPLSCKFVDIGDRCKV